MKDDKTRRNITTHRITLSGTSPKNPGGGSAAPRGQQADGLKVPRPPVARGAFDEDAPRKRPVVGVNESESRERSWDDEPVINRRKPRGKEPIPLWSLILLLAVITIIAAISLYFFVLRNNEAIAPAPTETPEETVAPTPTPTPVPTPTPTPVPTPTPTPDPYFTSEEQVVADAEKGYWLYSSPTLWVEINRIFDSEKIITSFVAEVRVKPGEERERGGFPQIGKPNAQNRALYKIARQYKAVVAINGDFLDDNIHEDPKGVIIRDGIVCADSNKNQTLAFMPDGTLRLFEKNETSADELLAMGVMNSFSFGPTLIKDGVIQDEVSKHRLRSANPRSAVGIIEPYHYLLVVVDGRSPSKYSRGMTLTELAELFASYNCEIAYNLDGGQSAAMSFMGNNISKYNGSHTGQRSSADALMFGTSDLVPPLE